MIRESIAGYKLSEELYSSSRTLVYRGVREIDSLPVVIKLLKNSYPSFSELVQFRNNYIIAKDLHSPLIIQTYSLEPYQNGYVLVMEDFGGVSLKDYFRSWETLHTNSLHEFLLIAIALANAVEILHQHQVIHKAIKPSNILINSQTKQVKLIDFSLSSLLPRETQAPISINVSQEALAYISPEQTGRMNRAIDYRTDFYSLGVTFYELLTGELPFPSNDPMELVYCHIAKEVPLVHQINPQIPSVLSEIVRKLMAKNAEDRYQSALGLKFDLENCRTQLNETGRIQRFEIAQRDVCDRFLIPEKLYGRETEVKTLLQAFERVSLGASEIMLVAGFSGIGKTVIVKEVYKAIIKQRGYFIKGKFDQFQKNIPFSGFVQAFRELIGLLLTESDTQIQQWKSKILEAVGENGQIIIEIIPELEKIIGQQPSVPEVSGISAQNRFNLLFQKFTQVFTSAKHPLVMFLDDLQWADSASLKLIQLFMAGTGHLLLIGAYRDNETSSAHPLMLTLSEIKKTQGIVNTIILAPLREEELNHLVADTLKCTENLALPLSQLVYRRTQGNPFFSIQFFLSLYQDKLIKFDWDLGCWQCDITLINQLVATDDVVKFMACQLQKLPQQTQNILQLAACIGNRFDLDTLAIVSQKSDLETASDLWEALQLGLILPTSDIYKFYQEDNNDKLLLKNRNSSQQLAQYKFLHDRIRQAAYSLIPQHQQQVTYYRIGKILLQQIPPQAREDRFFEVVNQLNYGISLITEQSERDELVQLNLTACRKAKDATAYQAAYEYANVALSLLAKNVWQQHYEIALSLYELASEIAYLCGEFTKMEKLIDTVTKQAHFLPEQVNAYRTRIQCNISQGKFAEAIAIARQILLRLGVTLPPTSTSNDILREIQDIRELIGGRKIEDLVHLPLMTDREKIAIIKITSSIFSAAYLSGSPLFASLICLSVKLSIQYGNTSASAFSYANYGFIMCNRLQDIDTATQFGHLALRLVSSLNTKAAKPEVSFLVAGYILHRTTHIREILPLFQEGYAAALEVGNLEFVGYNANFFCNSCFWCGYNLSTLEQDIRAYSDELLKYNQLITAEQTQIYWQCILNLLGFSEHPTILSGEVMQEEEFLSFKISASNKYYLYFFYLYKLLLCYLFEETEVGNKIATEARPYIIAGSGLFYETAFYFYDSLIALATLNQDSDEASEVLRRVTHNQTLLQEQWGNYAPMNHQHKIDLVEAEKYRVLGKNYQAGDWYDRAIAVAKQNEYLQEEALANELAAKFYLNWGKHKVAAVYMQEAYYCYARWGALAKTNHLEQLYPQLLKPILQQRQINLKPPQNIAFCGAFLSSQTSITSISDILDFTSLLKAAQTISKSIELNQLIANLTRIILENSGAQTCVLILPQQKDTASPLTQLAKDTLQVSAITFFKDEEIQTLLTPQSLQNCQDIPIKIINYVKNTRQTLVINNCKTDIPGVIDKYMLEYQPQSVLCTPILNQGYLTGILYLEHRLVQGVFTSGRLSIIHLLSSQAAISLENARLYQQAKQALHDLQQAQLQIVQSEKMSTLGNLVAGVAHEMNNPLGFISVSLEQTKPLIADIFEHLKLYKQTLSNPSQEIIDHAKKIDLDYSLEDLPAMLDSMMMACDRLTNISDSLRTFSRKDKDYKVLFNIHSGIDSTILILKHRLKANEQRPAIEVTTNYGDLPEILCFPGQLNQVFMNIIANAIDALEESNIGRTLEEIKASHNKITITTSVENNQVQVAIADNGIGMNEEVKQKIFNHLFTTKPVGKGTGLGLAIAKQIIVEKHNGTLTVNSILGQGTEFIITLPAVGWVDSYLAPIK